MSPSTMLILQEIQAALVVAAAVPMPVEGEAAVQGAAVLESIVLSSLKAYQNEIGTPFDLSKLTLEDPV